MGLTHRFTVGKLVCHAIEAGTVRFDGGAMFGVVPKPLWSRRIPADERNRIGLATRSLLIEHPEGPILIDTGVGNKESPKFHEIYGIENTAPSGRTNLEEGLNQAGLTPDDVRWVVNSHLHFDHAGGNTYEQTDPGGVAVGGPRLTFPKATYVVQRDELEFARHTNERTRAAYLPANFEPIAEAGRWKLLRGEVDILEGVSARLTPGHVPHHQSIVVKNGGETLLFLGDVMPTQHHLPLPWIMGYDLEPMRTLESKRKLLRVAEDDGWRLFFSHDPEVIMGRLGESDEGLALGDLVTVAPHRFEGL